MSRVVSLDEAAAASARAKDAKKRVVLANGHFDLIHVGHVRYLEGARAEGGFLVPSACAPGLVRWGPISRLRVGNCPGLAARAEYPGPHGCGPNGEAASYPTQAPRNQDSDLHQPLVAVTGVPRSTS